jgi:hypothetical protein
MKLSRTLQISVVTAVCTAVAAQSALAGGEPKNTGPFTRSLPPARSYAAAVITASATASARAASMGESKSGQPFARRLNADALERFLEHSSRPTTIASLGEPKNQAPFTLHLGRGA